MELPKLSPGKRFTLPRPLGSADSLLLARLAERDKAGGRTTAIVTADATDAQRLIDEMAFFAPALRCALFPDWETLPYDSFSPHQDLISERLATLWRISQHDRHDGADVVLIPASTALYRLGPPSFLAGYTFHFKTGQQLDEAALRRQLTMAGYAHVSQVVSPGEYAVRGSLIDLYPMGAEQPYRVDLFDDEIDSIRTFDPDSQRSLEPVQEVRLLPGREFPMDDAARSRFRNKWRELMEGDPTRSRIYKDMGEGLATAGIEYYLPLFFDETASVFDYLPAASTLVLHDALEQPFQRFWQDTRERYRLMAGDPERPALPPEALFLSEEQFFTQAKRFAQLSLRPHGGDTGLYPEFSALPDVSAARGSEDPLLRLQGHVQLSPHRVLLLAESAGRRESLLDFLRASHLQPVAIDNLQEFLDNGEKIGLAASPLMAGFAWNELGIDLITEAELFAGSGGVTHRRRRRQEQASDVDTLIKDLSELKVGDPVVHSAHGIGRYQGLINMDVGQKNPDGSAALQEFLHLEYAGDATLYVPVSQLHLISRYTGVSADDAPLHKLGGSQWEKAKRKAAEQVRDTAAELLNIYARRAAREGFAFRFSPADYEVFANDFGFDETADQLAAIHSVIQDMVSPRPMDRLVCGDVGFGKTEVALRAAFCAVAGGRQVAVLCPTTLLCEQHFQTFSDRFADWPVKIVELSRFKTAKETTQALKELAEGKVDIVIGTHKLLQKDVKFTRLGLVVIDEEHRFGVRQKEALKALRAEVDVLTLTATPIPRTLGMSLEGLRDFSVIATAPQKRLAIKTFVSRYSDGIIREALLREFKRGGQVYFLHNEVDTIENMRDKLSKLLPEARIVVGHGQMNERELERVMRDFTQQRANLLLCTTIIETGIDNPHANTIVINRADKFGLAQLHQLRGRVGRSHHQAYAYLLTHGEADGTSGLTKQAKQRLEAIQMMDELGAGFYLAMHDLEIRGAGEVLGENQSGEMQEVGFNLFTEMLNRAVSALRQGKEPDLLQPLGIATEINLHTPALLPNDYAPDVHERLTLYKRFANCDSLDDLSTMQEELVDRFGELPPQAQSLLESHRLRLLCKPLGIVKLDATASNIVVQFEPNPPIEPIRIINLIQKDRNYKLAGQDKLSLTRQCPTLADRVGAVKDLIRQLKP